MNWSDEMIIRLRALWDEGVSTAEIGRRLGVSKNAAVGKAHRLDLPERPSPINFPSQPRAPKPVRVRAAPSLPTLACLVPAVPAPNIPTRATHREPTPVQLPRPVIAVPKPAIAPSSFKTCQWIYGDSRPARFCEAATQAPSSYCAEHHARCYTTRAAYGYGEPAVAV